RRVQPPPPAPGHGDPRPGLRQPLRDLEAETSRGTGHDRDLAVEIEQVPDVHASTLLWPGTGPDAPASRETREPGRRDRPGTARSCGSGGASHSPELAGTDAASGHHRRDTEGLTRTATARTLTSATVSPFGHRAAGPKIDRAKVTLRSATTIAR